MCSMDMRRPFVCLECAHTACLFRDPVREPSLPVSVGSARSAEHIEHGTSHMGLHLAEESHAYGTWPPDPACDIVHGTLFCAACDDVVYDPRFLYVCEQETRRSHVMRPDEHALDTSMAQDALCTSPRSPQRATAPRCPAYAEVRRPTHPVPRGLRNMGATCFLNVILQSFLHNPLLRNFFLSDRHNAGLCAVGPYCLACEMDRLYREVRTPHSPQFYTPSDTPAPHGPTSFLYAIWVDSSSAELSQSGQHDAHEMFISALNGIHTALTAYALERSKLPSAPWDSADTLKHLSEHADVTGAGADMPKRAVDHSARCPCVVHRTFCGRLQSTITCASCRQMTHTREPFLDLSLEVRARDPRDTDDRNKKKDTKRRDKATPSLDTSLETLQACLQRYCSPELLPDNSYKCSHCQQTSKATKQLSLLQLPPVLCIQLKVRGATHAALRARPRRHQGRHARPLSAHARCRRLLRRRRVGGRAAGPVRVRVRPVHRRRPRGHPDVRALHQLFQVAGALVPLRRRQGHSCQSVSGSRRASLSTVLHTPPVAKPHEPWPGARIVGKYIHSRHDLTCRLDEAHGTRAATSPARSEASSQATTSCSG